MTVSKGPVSSNGPLPVVKQPELPVCEAKSRIIDLVRKNPSVVIVGETGSGKTTQIPQYVLDGVVNEGAVGGKKGIVGVTQPRRVAAVSIARYVASLRGCEIGKEVGYSVRFDDVSSNETQLKFMTDGILLREILADPSLSRYSAIILDEAHERTLHGDVLFGLLKDVLRRREKDLRIIVMSATLNAKHFSTFWFNAPVGVVHGRSFPVTLFHTAGPEADYVDGVINTVLQIHAEEGPGDVLCFLTGQEEIEDAKRLLEERMKLLPSKIPDFLVLTIYAALPYEQQLKVFDKTPSGQRKVILATNIAETSITIEGIKFVVDCGLVKAKSFNPRAGLESLQEVPISRAQATQRAGRAGRVQEGRCFRLYTESQADGLAPDTVPEIKRCSLASVVLQMKAMGIQDPLQFEFMDMPSPDAVVQAQNVLILLGALDANLRITALGRRLTDFPIDPAAAKVLLVGQQLGVGEEVTTVIAMLATENVFLTGPSHRELADKCKMAHAKTVGDHITLLHIFAAYRRAPRKEKEQWCQANAINSRQMKKAIDVMTQLSHILSEGGAAVDTGIGSAADGGKKRPREQGDSGDGSAARESEEFHDHPLVRRAFCSGFFMNTAYFDAKEQKYITLLGHYEVQLHPSSVLFSFVRKKPQLVIYNAVVRTSNKYMKDVVAVKDEWLQEAAPNFFVSR